MDKSKEYFDGYLHFADGMAQPMLNYSPNTQPNEDSDILRFCVYVETDHDTDSDGWADLVKAYVQLPRSAAEGKYKAAAIYDPTPYPAGQYANPMGYLAYPYAEKHYDYKKLYEPGMKRESAGMISTLEAAKQAEMKDWVYSVPITGKNSYYNSERYDYYLIRGFAVVQACGIGTYGSEGFQLCGWDLEMESHKCVVEWLAGERPAFTDRKNRIEIKADWCSGNIAMTGKSYGGTLPFEVATSGVKGLKTIIPVAGIASWYDYTNSQGISINGRPNYTDCLAHLNSGATFEDDDWTVSSQEYGACLWQIASDQIAANGNYTDIWAGMDYSVHSDKINCSALIVHGLNDFNVQMKQAVLMYNAFKKAGRTVKAIFHQDGHDFLFGRMVNGMLYEELMNRWLCHYLYGIENGIENMAEITVQSNVDGTYSTYASWDEVETEKIPVHYSADRQTVHNGNFDRLGEDFVKKQKNEEEYYLHLDKDHAAVYELDFPEGKTIYGIPEVHVRVSADDPEQDKLMLTAMIADVCADGKPFKAYLYKKALDNHMPVKTVGTYEYGGGHAAEKLKEYVKSPTDGKIFAYGWTDLHNPGKGWDSFEYTRDEPLEKGRFYDYTLYLSPTVYTVEKGHRLKLILMAQDPYRTRFDEAEGDRDNDGFFRGAVDPVYSFTVDNPSIEVTMPFAKKGNLIS